MTLQKTIALLEQYEATHPHFRENLIKGTVADEDVKALLDPSLFTPSVGVYSFKKPVDDSNHSRLDLIRDFVQTIGVFLTAESLHQFTSQLIKLAPQCDKNTFMRTTTLEKIVLAYEMSRQPELAKEHFSSERMIKEIPDAKLVQNLIDKMLKPNVIFFDTPQLKQLMKLCDDYKKHLKKSVGEYDLTQKNPSPHDALTYQQALRKYQLVQQMIDTLMDIRFDSAQRIKNMSALLSPANQDCLKGHRNASFGARFLEAILHIITLGIYSKVSKDSFAFWKSHGEVLCDSIESLTTLKPV